jgi:hypothetical protein
VLPLHWLVIVAPRRIILTDPRGAGESRIVCKLVSELLHTAADHPITLYFSRKKRWDGSQNLRSRASPITPDELERVAAGTAAAIPPLTGYSGHTPIVLGGFRDPNAS